MKPSDEAGVAEAIKGARHPLSISGGGTRGVQTTGEAFYTSGLTGVRLYEPGALTVVAAAGTPLSEIEEMLSAEGQRLAFEPVDTREILGTKGVSTIGGVFATNASGSRRIQAGAARDHLLGVRFVDGAGQIISNGGRVMKNVTGYDLVKLMAGAYGTLGVLTEVSFKVLPTPETEATVCVHDVALEDAVAALSAALGTPFDVTGAAFDPAARTAYLRIEGFAPSVSYRSARLTDHLAQYGEISLVEDSSTTWRHISQLSALRDTPGDLWKLSVKPTDAANVLAKLSARATLLDWGGGLIWAVMPEGQDLRRLLDVPGHATLIRAKAETHERLPRFQPEPTALQALSRGLRAKFDPRGILNPGLMG